MYRLVILILASWECAHGQVYITGVNPSQGSLAGGTRLVIRGSGFSANTNAAGNAVFVGSRYFCDPIPLHSTVNQIICKTRSALDGYYSTYEALWTLPQNISVIVDGSQTSSCLPSSGQTCTFQYSTAWCVFRPRERGREGGREGGMEGGSRRERAIERKRKREREREQERERDVRLSVSARELVRESDRA
jgi:hypothetical protein